MILSRWPYRKKVKYLWLFVIIFLFIMYQLAFKESISAGRVYYNYQNKINEFKTAPAQIEEMIKQQSQMDVYVIKNDTMNTEWIRQQLLLKTADFCSKNKIILKELQKSITNTNKKITIETNIIKLEGSYKKLITF